MKHLAFLIAAAAALSSSAFAQTTIVGSGHDFTATFGGNEICKPCHTPHDAYPYPGNTVDRVLWNHQETTQTFTMYTTLAGNQGTPDGTSLLCLSCHDGVTAMDNYGGNTGGSTVLTGDHVVGLDLSNDHPIGLEYPATDPNYQPVPLNNLPLYNDGSIDRIECSSCHDPHGAGYPNFLRDATAGSQLCLDCHNV